MKDAPSPCMLEGSKFDVTKNQGHRKALTTFSSCCTLSCNVTTSCLNRFTVSCVSSLSSSSILLGSSSSGTRLRFLEPPCPPEGACSGSSLVILSSTPRWTRRRCSWRFSFRVNPSPVLRLQSGCGHMREVLGPPHML